MNQKVQASQDYSSDFTKNVKALVGKGLRKGARDSLDFDFQKEKGENGRYRDSSKIKGIKEQYAGANVLPSINEVQ